MGVPTSKHTDANAYTSDHVVSSKEPGLSSAIAKMSSGAIHLVDPPQDDEPCRERAHSATSSRTFDNPKSVRMGLPSESMRMLP